MEGQLIVVAFLAAFGIIWLYATIDEYNRGEASLVFLIISLIICIPSIIVGIYGFIWIFKNCTIVY